MGVLADGLESYSEQEQSLQKLHKYSLKTATVFPKTRAVFSKTAAEFFKTAAVFEEPPNSLLNTPKY